MTALNHSAAQTVSVIVPIYNAERFLGYCLNSLVRQTYTHWQAILIDDGSTDGSLTIARQYAALDSRFEVIAIPNGGVSHARNVGLEHAQGTYLHFLDSDDVLAPETLERQVAAAIKYGKQLIIHDVLIVDFTAPERHGPRLSGKWLGHTPAVLDAASFQKMRMQLIWHTALLEGLYGKLYDRRLWEHLQLRFPEELSLGEDFVTNLKYYAACNGAVFLQQIGHYYNNICNSDSLTHKYRPDLFETKMYLMDRLWTHLHSDHTPTITEVTCFYNYAAATGLYCVDEVLAPHHALHAKTKRERLNTISRHPLFRTALVRAEHLPERFLHYVPNIRQRNVRKLIRSVRPVTPRTTLPNRALRWFLRILRPISGPFAPKLERLESALAAHGIRHTLRMVRQRIRRRP